MLYGGHTIADWLVLARQELMLFAGVFFLIGALDEWAVDLSYLWLRLTGRAGSRRLAHGVAETEPLRGRCAVFIPAWQEQRVICATIAHTLAVWPHEELRLYVGCYRNDAATIAAAMAGARGDSRMRIVVHDRIGPSCKADCLNRLYRALREDEMRSGSVTRMVVLHDAEDMVDRAALSLLDCALDSAEFIQLPVLALPQARSPLVAGHYTDEFADAHARTLVVRSALGQGIPGAGVGSAIRRDWLDRLVEARGGEAPFATGALTEDYELGLRLAQMGARSRLLRVRAADGRLIATRAYFPAGMAAAIRQKARWLHGIAFQGWEQLGWRGRPAGLWMQLRDRRGPLAALLLAIAYCLVIAEGIALVLRLAGLAAPVPLPSGLELLLTANIVAFAWRLAVRALFTGREFGWSQGLLAIPRVIVSNTVAIVAARRALVTYTRSLLSGRPSLWDKTEHTEHPAIPALRLTEQRA